MVLKSGCKKSENKVESAEKQQVNHEKRTLREILSSYWKKNKKESKDTVEGANFNDVNKDMEKAKRAFNSIMDIHKILAASYKKFEE